MNRVPTPQPAEFSPAPKSTRGHHNQTLDGYGASQPPSSPLKPWGLPDDHSGVPEGRRGPERSSNLPEVTQPAAAVWLQNPCSLCSTSTTLYQRKAKDHGFRNTRATPLCDSTPPPPQGAGKNWLSVRGKDHSHRFVVVPSTPNLRASLPKTGIERLREEGADLHGGNTHPVAGIKLPTG